MKRAAIVAGIVVALVAALLVGWCVYYRIEWMLMDNACSSGPPPAGVSEMSGVGFSLTKDGFTCTYDDGTVRSSWFWL